MAWTDERLERLEELWAEGYSGSEISRILGDVSRNSVLGKVQRLGSGRSTPAKPQRGIKPKTASKTEVFPSVLKETTVPTEDSRPTRNNCHKTCKWPEGDPLGDDFYFCGKPTIPGKSYCQSHAKIAHRSGNEQPSTTS